MKLGSETGSLVNHLSSRAVIGEPMPVVGMGATMLSWTDRHAATIVEVVIDKGKVKRIAVTQDDCKRVDKNGMSEDQDYEFTSNVNGHRYWYGKDRKGLWVHVAFDETTKRWKQSRSGGLAIGYRSEYHDFSF